MAAIMEQGSKPMERYVIEHPLREELVLEVHARPFAPLAAPVRGSHLAVLTGEVGADESARHLATLCEELGAPAPAPGAKHHSQDLGEFHLRWEHHTEFCAYTFLRAEAFTNPFADPVIGRVPRDWLRGLPGETLAAIHFAIEPGSAPERDAAALSGLFAGNPVVGSTVAGGAARAWSDLRTHDDRFSRVFIRDGSMTLGQAGRLVQRLMEINAYRMLALLALPVARQISPRIREVDAALAEITGTLADSAGGGERALLEQLSVLASELEKIGALTSYRFSAARAYHDIVQRRLREIRQQRIEGVQTFSDFLERRLAPAMNSVTSTAERIELLSERMSRVGSLIRARVEVQIEEQNRDVLASMDKRAQTQLRLQRIVESLSVVAITYYLASMVKFILESLEAAESIPLGVNPAIGVGVSVPFIAALVWFGLRRARRAIAHDDDASSGSA